MSKQLSTVTATFRQNLRGQLPWLECAPHWACAAIYAERIHPLIVEFGKTKCSDAEIDTVGALLDALHDCEPGDCLDVISKWLTENPE